MRSIRRAAIAGATAATLILGAANVATAETANNADSKEAATNANENDTSDGKAGSSAKEVANDLKYILAPNKDLDAHPGQREGWARNLSGRAGTVLEADKPANGARLFGSTDEVKLEPKWAQWMLAITYIGAIGSVLGLVVFPAYNFLLANGMLPWSPR